MTNLSRITLATSINSELAKLAGVVASLDPEEGLSATALSALQTLAEHAIASAAGAVEESQS